MSPRPDLTPIVTALRTTDSRYPWIGPSDDEDDVAAFLEVIQAEHQGSSEEVAEDNGVQHWGRCTACGTFWPCSTYVEAEYLGVQFLGRASARVMARVSKAVASHTRLQMHQQASAPDSEHVEAPDVLR